MMCTDTTKTATAFHETKSPVYIADRLGCNSTSNRCVFVYYVHFQQQNLCNMPNILNKIIHIVSIHSQLILSYINKHSE